MDTIFNAGVDLILYKTDNADFIFELYTQFGTNDLYIRKWDRINNLCKDLKPISSYNNSICGSICIECKDSKES